MMRPGEKEKGVDFQFGGLHRYPPIPLKVEWRRGEEGGLKVLLQAL